MNPTATQFYLFYSLARGYWSTSALKWHSSRTRRFRVMCPTLGRSSFACVARRPVHRDQRARKRRFLSLAWCIELYHTVCLFSILAYLFLMYNEFIVPTFSFTVLGCLISPRTFLLIYSIQYNADARENHRSLSFKSRRGHIKLFSNTIKYKVYTCTRNLILCVTYKLLVHLYNDGILFLASSLTHLDLVHNFILWLYSILKAHILYFVDFLFDENLTHT